MILTAIVCLSLESCVEAPVNVIDGSSFSVAGETVRIRGIDTPRADGNCPAEKHLANRALSTLEYILDGRRIEINRTGKTPDGTTLASVTSDGRNVADGMYSQGLAHRWGSGLKSWCRT